MSSSSNPKAGSSSSASIDFYFDFTSPFGYLASERIEALAAAHQRVVSWKPLVLGFIFKVTGSQPLVNHPLKGEYSIMDIQRSAREHGISYSLPSEFPIGTVAAARAALWLQQAHPEVLSDFIHAAYRQYFITGNNLSDPAVVLDAAAEIGIDRDELSAALGDGDVKALLKQATDDAIERGVFGSPTMIVDGEMFWGHDRLEQLERWLVRGGW